MMVCVGGRSMVASLLFVSFSFVVSELPCIVITTPSTSLDLIESDERSDSIYSCGVEAMGVVRAILFASAIELIIASFESSRILSTVAVFSFDTSLL